MKKNQSLSYHIEARGLGVLNFNAIKEIDCKRRIAADKLRSIWDYRSAGLKIDDARAKLESWNRRSYHRYQRGQKQIDNHTGGRIITMAQVAARRKVAYRAGIKEIMALRDDDTSLGWTCPRVRWESGGRSIVTVRHNDVKWSKNRKCHYPTSSTVSYTSHLIRLDEPSTIEAYNLNELDILEAATEKKFNHDLRGSWRQKVVRELLNIDYAPEEEPAIFYKKVAVCPAFPQTVFASVYDGSPYEIRETRREVAMRNHRGGLYCYKTAEEALNAPFPDNSVLKTAEKKIIAVEIKGKRIRYENGKYAVSEMTPIEVV